MSVQLVNVVPRAKLFICEQCRWQKELCICDRLPSFELTTRFVIVQHASELFRQSNTGRWVPRLLTNSAIVTHGSSEDRAPCRLEESLIGNAYVLFPLAGIPPLTAELAATPSTFVILDGTWAQARRMVRRVPGIRCLPLVALPHGTPPGSWRARRSPEPRRLCTLETVARVLRVIGSSDAASQVERTLQEIDSCLLHARGRRGRKAKSFPAPHRLRR